MASIIVSSIYLVASITSAVILIHAYLMKKKLGTLATKLKASPDGEDQPSDAVSDQDLASDDESETLSWYLTHQLGKKPFMLKLQDRVQDNFFLGFFVILIAFVMAPTTLALIFLLYAAFGIDLATFFISGGFIVFIYVSEYPELITYSRSTTQLLDMTKFTTRDEQILTKAIHKLKLLQSNLLLLLPTFIFFTMNYDYFLASLAHAVAWLSLHVHALLLATLIPILGSLIDERFLYFISTGITMIIIAGLVPVIGKAWQKTGAIRATLMP